MADNTKETKAAAKAAPVSANPALVEFPRDVWGMTAELRKAGLRAAAAVRGNQEKQTLFLNTLRVLAQHAQARLAGDAEAVAARVAAIEERTKHEGQRQATRGVPTPEAAPQPEQDA